MADVVTRLRLESSEYDSKIKRATQGLLEMERECRSVGGTLAVLEKDQKQYVQALGKMDTVSKTVKGKLNELTQAYTELSVQYKRLTDEEKQGDFGKALAASLEQLKGRINETKGQLGEVNQELGNTKTESESAGGALEELAGKFGLSVKQMLSFGTVLAAAKGALEVMKDAFFNSEEGLDEWGRVVQSSHSVYEGFLNSLNTGDISGFLHNIDNIVQASREAYDALDALGTFNAFNQINVEKTRTGMNEAIVDYREGSGTKEQARDAGEAYKAELRERQKLEREAYTKAVKDLAAQRGISEKDLRDALGGSYGNYSQLKSVMPSGTRTTTQFQGPGMAPLVQTEKVATNRAEELGVALRNINDTELQTLQALGAQAERTGYEITQVDRQLARLLGGRSGGGASSGGGGGGGGGETVVGSGLKEPKLFAVELASTIPSMKELRAELSAFKSAMENATTAYDYGVAEAGAANVEKQIAAQPLALQAGLDLDTAAKVKEQMDGGLFEQIQEQLSQYAFELDVSLKSDEGVETLTKDGDKTAKSWSNASKAIGAVGSALQTIEDPSAKIAGTIGQAIATIAATFAASLKGTFTPWDWIAAAAAGAATMVSTIAAIKSATSGGYAMGGIIPGNSYSGDNQIASVNAGELILNRAQQYNVAAQLENSTPAAFASTPYVSGEQILLGVNNHVRRTGQGEIVTTKMLNQMGIK